VNILSIQSHVVYGHVGNSAAVFALQRLGVEVWPVHTVQFSNHTGYETFRGAAFEANHVLDLLQGLGERRAFARCDAVLSGYVASADMGLAILNAVARNKRVNAQALYCCDPVLGDVGRGLFVKPEVADFVRTRTVPASDVVTPNHFELEAITGRAIRDLAQALSAIDALRALGPNVVLVTSLQIADTPPDIVDLVACDGAGRYRLRTPKLPVAAHGAGDLIAALFLAHYVRLRSAAAALERAAASVFGILKLTANLDAEEMALIEAQDELVNPSTKFSAESL
jgi:pyridoxine kinase